MALFQTYNVRQRRVRPTIQGTGRLLLDAQRNKKQSVIQIFAFPPAALLFSSLLNREMLLAFDKKLVAVLEIKKVIPYSD